MRVVQADPSAHMTLGSEESEIALIGSVLNEPESFTLASSLVEPTDFSSPRLCALWAAMEAVAETGALPDPHLVLEQLDRTGGMDLAGGRDGILAVVESYRGTGRNAEHYARRIRDAAGSRRIAALASEIADRARTGEAPRVLSETWDAGLRELRVGGEERTTSLRDALEESFREIGAEVTGAYVTTGYTALDSMLIGFDGGQLILVGGRPSMGKTALALNFAVNAASHGTPVAFMSLEMTRRELVRRLLAWASGISFTKVRQRGWIPDENERYAIDSAGAWLRALPLWIDDTPGLSLSTLKMKMRRLVDRGVRAFFVDYLGLMTPPKSRTISNRENEVGTISRGLKRLAKEFDVPVVALQQLSREKAKSNENVQGDATKVVRPGLTDLRDSGSLEQDADVVMFVHRDAYYTKDPHDHVAKVIVAKQRNGECGDVSLAWDGATQKFVNLDPTGDPRDEGRAS